MVFVVDNFDSFTFNLVQYLGQLGEEPVVRRNNQISIAEIKELNPSRIVISPGPGKPEDAKGSVDVVQACFSCELADIPLLGVCLGHQIICMVSGARVIHAPLPMHGKTSEVVHDRVGVMSEIPSPVEVVRYHSLMAELSSIPDSLEVTGKTNDDETVMCVRHKELPIEGVQFHPESIKTDFGLQMIQNFVQSGQPV